MVHSSTGNTLAPQLLAGHLAHEAFEFDARQVIADTLQPAREVLSNCFFSVRCGFTTEATRAFKSGSANSSYAF
jgi:hypothetical protein